MNRFGQPHMKQTPDGSLYILTCRCGWERRVTSGGLGFTTASRLIDRHASSHEEPDYSDPYAAAN